MAALQLQAGTRQPWVGLGASVWLQMASGTPYTFPLYSHSLKSNLGFSQQQLTFLGVANDLGENVGILPGFVCNKFPPWVLLLIGAFSCFFGYGVLWLTLTHKVQSMPYWLLCLALCVATNSSAWLSTAVLVTNMRNFPFSRGTVAGILKGYAGLSAAVYTEVYSLALHHSSSKLLMFLALGVPILCLIMMFFVKPCTPSSSVENSSECGHYLLFIQVASIMLGVFLVTTTALKSLSTPIFYIFLVVMVFLLMAPLAVPIKMTLFPISPLTSGIHDQTFGSADRSTIEGEGSADNTEPLLIPLFSPTENLGSFHKSDESSEIKILPAEGEGPSSSTSNLGSFHKSDGSSDINLLLAEGRKPRRGENFEFTQVLIKADFWLLFMVYFVGVGSGVTVLNNLAQIGIARGVHDTTILLCLFSFFNFIGRLGGGAVSEHFVRSRTKTTPRTVCITCTQGIMIVIYLLFAFAVHGTLYAATALLGICYGVQFSIVVSTVSELFGLKHFGIIYNVISLGNPLGAFLFSGLLAGYIYDKEVKTPGVPCVGPNCFRLTFQILAGACLLGSVLSFVLTKRIEPVYKKLYAGGSQNSNNRETNVNREQESSS